SDIFLLLSQKESFGLALLEAMHCGSVPVGSTAGGMSAVLRDGETGHIIEVGDYRPGAEKVTGRLEVPNRAETMQHQMMEDSSIRFRTDVIIEEYEALYQRLTGDMQHG